MLIRDSTSINFSKFSKRYIYLLTPGSTWLSIFTTVSGRYTYSGRYVNWISIICPVGTFIPVGTTIQDLRVYIHFQTSTDLIDPPHKSNDTSDKYPIMNHFVTEMCIHGHISVKNWCIMGYGTGALWDLWDWSILKLTAWQVALGKVFFYILQKLFWDTWSSATSYLLKMCQLFSRLKGSFVTYS